MTNPNLITALHRLKGVDMIFYLAVLRRVREDGFYYRILERGADPRAPSATFPVSAKT